MPHWEDNSKIHELANLRNWQTVGLLLSRTVVYGLWKKRKKRKIYVIYFGEVIQDIKSPGNRI